MARDKLQLVLTPTAMPSIPSNCVFPLSAFPPSSSQRHRSPCRVAQICVGRGPFAHGSSVLGRSMCRAAARTCGALRPPLKEVASESGATLARQRWIYTRPRGVLASLALPAPRKVDVDFYAHYYRILFFEKDLRR